MYKIKRMSFLDVFVRLQTEVNLCEAMYVVVIFIGAPLSTYLKIILHNVALAMSLLLNVMNCKRYPFVFLSKTSRVGCVFSQDIQQERSCEVMLNMVVGVKYTTIQLLYQQHCANLDLLCAGIRLRCFKNEVRILGKTSEGCSGSQVL